MSKLREAAQELVDWYYDANKTSLEAAGLIARLSSALAAEDEGDIEAADKRLEEASVAMANALDKWDKDYDEGGSIAWRDVADIIEVWRQARRDRPTHSKDYEPLIEMIDRSIGQVRGDSSASVLQGRAIVAAWRGDAATKGRG